MKLLFIHPNMPGQYKHLARAFGAEGGHDIYFITKHKTAEIPGVTRATYQLSKSPARETHRYLVPAAHAVIQGQHVWRVCQDLKTKRGFTPDVIIAHPGWGDALFVKDIFPNTPLLNFCEFYYRATNADVGFDAPITDDDIARVRIKNTNNILNLEAMDWGISPTFWQWSVHPPEFRSKISVLHDGINTADCVPNPNASFTLKNGKTFRYGDEVVLYIARNFEPYRGFPTFMQAAEILLKRRPNCHIIAVGADGVSYGKQAGDGKTYRQIWSEKVNLPQDRVHFIGTVPYGDLMTLIQLAAAQLYLTMPFVLSWSMLESMACGAALVASRTKPVEEVITDGVNGLLVDFFSPQEVANKLEQLLDAPDKNAALRAAARGTITTRYDLGTILPLQMQLVRDLAAQQLPPVTAQKIAALNPIGPHNHALWKA